MTQRSAADRPAVTGTEIQGRVLDFLDRSSLGAANGGKRIDTRVITTSWQRMRGASGIGPGPGA
jgi:hypothetical protein